MSAFEPCLAVVLREEGGFSNNPRDPGGMTIVLIARGGAMSIKLPGGTEIIASAGAAKALATDTNVKDITQPTGDSQ